MSKKTPEVLEKIREAWDHMPKGSKERLYTVFGYSRQIVADMLKNGRKDKALLDSLLCAIKQSSKDVATEYNEQNKTVQKI